MASEKVSQLQYFATYTTLKNASQKDFKRTKVHLYKTSSWEVLKKYLMSIDRPDIYLVHQDLSGPEAKSFRQLSFESKEPLFFVLIGWPTDMIGRCLDEAAEVQTGKHVWIRAKSAEEAESIVEKSLSNNDIIEMVLPVEGPITIKL